MRTYSIRFNKTLYKRYLVTSTRDTLTEFLVAGLILFGCWWLASRNLVGDWIVVIGVIVALYIAVAPLLLVLDWLDYRSIHVVGKRGKAASARKRRRQGGARSASRAKSPPSPETGDESTD